MAPRPVGQWLVQWLLMLLSAPVIRAGGQTRTASEEQPPINAFPPNRLSANKLLPSFSDVPCIGSVEPTLAKDGGDGLLRFGDSMLTFAFDSKGLGLVNLTACDPNTGQ